MIYHDETKNHIIGISVCRSCSFCTVICRKRLEHYQPFFRRSDYRLLASDELQGREAGFHGSYVSSEYIASLLRWMGIQPLNESYFQPFDAYRKERQKKGRLEVHPDSIAKLKQEVHQKLSMRNVLGMIPGKIRRSM